MFYVILGVHLSLCVVLVILVLLQQGKGADMGAAFGAGASNTLFGAGGATSMIIKITTGVAVAFMVTSILLVKTYSSVGSSRAAKSSALAGSLMKDVKQEKPTDNAAPAEAAPQAPAAQQNAPAAPAKEGQANPAN